MHIDEDRKNSRRYRWLQRASSEQVLLWVHCFKRSNESIDTFLKLECLDSDLAESLSERDRLLSEIVSLKESLRLMQKDGEENS
jgi:hypothetical protein